MIKLLSATPLPSMIHPPLPTMIRPDTLDRKCPTLHINWDIVNQYFNIAPDTKTIRKTLTDAPDTDDPDSADDDASDAPNDNGNDSGSTDSNKYQYSLIKHNQYFKNTPDTKKH